MMGTSARTATLTRRSMLAKAAGVGAAAVVGVAVSASPAAAWGPTQAGFRFCNKCFEMFYWGFSNSGRCPKDGGVHEAIGWQFQLPYGDSSSWTPNDQPDWRACRNCFAVFFAGYADQGWCTFGGGHVRWPDGSGIWRDFVLPHDIGQPNGTQANWRFCNKCFCLFYWGYDPTDGVCIAGGQHAAAGFDFAIPTTY